MEGESQAARRLKARFLASAFRSGELTTTADRFVLSFRSGYQPELREVLFPVFVHTFLDLVETAQSAGKYIDSLFPSLPHSRDPELCIDFKLTIRY